MILEAVGVRKRFGALVVLHDVSFEVGAGEAVGIVGPNGAGKTTLLNVLAGSLHPTSGSVRFRDADVTAAGAAQRCRLGIARAHQVPRLITLAHSVSEIQDPPGRRFIRNQGGMHGSIRQTASLGHRGLSAV